MTILNLIESVLNMFGNQESVAEAMYDALYDAVQHAFEEELKCNNRFNLENLKQLVEFNERVVTQARLAASKIALEGQDRHEIMAGNIARRMANVIIAEAQDSAIRFGEKEFIISTELPDFIRKGNYTPDFINSLELSITADDVYIIPASIYDKALREQSETKLGMS